MSEENVFLIYALLLGVLITFVYDLLRIFRRVIPHRNFWVSLEDLGFWGFCGVEVFLLMYHESNGTLRWFAVLGALLGMLVYKKTISNFFVKYISLGLNKILGFLGKIAAFLVKPLVFIGKQIKKAAGKATGGMARKRKSLAYYIKNRLTHLWKVLKMVLSKQ